MAPALAAPHPSVRPIGIRPRPIGIRQSVQISLVIPVHNEAGNVVPLCREIAAVLGPRLRYEVIFVDDGSTDQSPAELTAEIAGRDGFRLIRHATRAGKSAALRTGITAARSDWIVTLDGDGQNDPADIPRLLELAWRDGRDARILVAGLRRGRRKDTASRKLASRFANWLRQALLKDGCVDTACSLKVFRRDGFLALPFFDSMHRFLPALFQIYGHSAINEPVNDRPRQHGRTKYTNLGRALVGIPDLLGVLWLKRRTTLAAVMAEADHTGSVAADRDRVAAG